MKKHIALLRYFDFLCDRPRLLARIAENYIRILVLRQKRLRIADIALTFKCNAKCIHCCSATLVNASKKEFTFEEIKVLMRQCIDLGAIIFNFLGGEPLLSDHILEAIRFAKANHTIAGISTNGLLLTSEFTGELKKSGLDVAQVDLEDINPAELDRIRNVNGCLDKVIKGIQNLKAQNIKVILSTIMTPQNIANGNIWKIVQLAKELKVIITVNAAAKVGAWLHKDEVSFSQNDIRVLRRFMKLHYVRWAGATNYLGEYCPCGTEKIFITAYGDVVPCGFIHVSYGNTREEPLEQIWKKMQVMKILPKAKQHFCPAAFDEELIKGYLDRLRPRKGFPVSVNELYGRER